MVNPEIVIVEKRSAQDLVPIDGPASGKVYLMCASREELDSPKARQLVMDFARQKWGFKNVALTATSPRGVTAVDQSGKPLEEAQKRDPDFMERSWLGYFPVAGD
jgi:hypothetical protein